MWSSVDIHEMSYITLGLTNDYCRLASRLRLQAARKTADYILQRWPMKRSNGRRSRADLPNNPPIVLHLAVIGLDAMLTLYRGNQRSGVIWTFASSNVSVAQAGIRPSFLAGVARSRAMCTPIRRMPDTNRAVVWPPTGREPFLGPPGAPFNSWPGWNGRHGCSRSDRVLDQRSERRGET